MRIVRYEQDWTSHYGLVEGNTIYHLQGDVYGEAWPGRKVGVWGDVKVLAPCTPHTMWSNGANYPARCYEQNAPLPTAPSVLWAPGTMICGPEADIQVPEFETRAEFGAELGIVLRRDCHDVTEAEAGDYILGYTALNNVWIKDPEQTTSARPLRVYDHNCPVGPLIDTDVDWRDLSIQLRVDGEARQDDRTSSMLFSPHMLVSWISGLAPMRQGDLIMTGTPGGVQGQVLHYGETVEVEIEGIGVLRNRVVRIDTGAVTYPVPVQTWLAQQAQPAP